MSIPRAKGGETRIKLHDLPESLDSGSGQMMEYPHLYRMRVGDWRISYAVEHNRLVILVLEGMTPEEITQERGGKKPRIKLRNLLESPTPEPAQSGEAFKKARIKLLDLLKDVKPEPIEGADVLKDAKERVADLLEEAAPEDVEAEPAERKPRIKVLDLPAEDV